MQPAALTLALLLPCLCAPAFAENLCDLPAFVSPQASSAPVLYDAPADGAATLGALAAPSAAMPARFTIRAVKNGYVQISDIKAAQSADLPPEAWIFAQDAAFVVQSSRGFAAPTPTAAAVYQTTSAVMPKQIAGLVACSGEWAQLQLVDKAQPDAIWMRGLCDQPNANCSGVTGD